MALRRSTEGRHRPASNSYSFNTQPFSLCYLARVLQDRLATEDLPGPRAGQRLLRLTGPILISNLFEFQSTVRADRSKTLVLDLAAVPYIDSAGIGALVGAFVAHQKDGRDLILLAVNERVRNALQVTRVESFFRFIDTLTDL